MRKNDGNRMVHIIISITRPILFLVILGFIYLLVFQKFGVGIPCVFRKLTGLKCPGCGMTHALSEIWNGNLKCAWEYNALSITVLPITCIYLCYRSIRESLRNGKEFYTWEYFFLAVLLGIVLIYGYVRNKV